MNVKILLVDDHPMLLGGLRQIVAQQPHLTLVGEASTGALGLKMASELAPDVVVLDVHLPDMNGIEVTRQILATQPFLKIIIFSGDATRALVDEALQAGACAYLLKLSAGAELLQAIDSVMAGKLYPSPEVGAGILEDYRKSRAGEAAPAKPVLSERETQLLRLIATGRRNKEIADRMTLSVKSIEAYRSRLMAKLGCASSADLVRYAIREWIVAP
jgi:DNA-binding NarL/FixJ family response regulator